MFDELFGAKAQLSAKIDGALDRMTKVMNLKEAAMRVNEDKLSEAMTEVLTKIADSVINEFEESVNEMKQEENI